MHEPMRMSASGAGSVECFIGGFSATTLWLHLGCSRPADQQSRHTFDLLGAAADGIDERTGAAAWGKPGSAATAESETPAVRRGALLRRVRLLGAAAIVIE